MMSDTQETKALLQKISAENNLEIHELYPGIQVSFFTLRGEEPLSFGHAPIGHVLEINYCIAGRIGWSMNHGNQIYLGPGDFSLHAMDLCSRSRAVLPNGFYEGLLISIDLKQLAETPPAALEGTGVTGEFLYEKFCRDKTATALMGNEAVRQIFAAFYQTPEPLRSAYQKIKVLELLLVLSQLDVRKEKHITEYRSEQAELIRQIHDQLTRDVSRRYSIESLAKQYLINTTTLKTMFKAVYGTSIAAHIREHRMETAARLLLSSDLSIAEIAARVGYGSQSRFSAAFQSHFHMLPSEYRRQTVS
ncbi:MAG: helix-turn-helix transcriptional regulator [Eubacteriales bacterium]|nr:helix-turn-helix transcriptional regulator [Eubacteriales bacterium]